MSNEKKSTYKRNFESNSAKTLTIEVVEKQIHAIWNEFERRLKTDSLDRNFAPTKNENAKGFLRREIYVLGRCLIANPPSYDPKDLVDGMRKNKMKLSDGETNTFHVLIMCVYEEDGGHFTRQERHQIGRELRYAHKHSIPPELVSGFLLQSGSRKEISKKLNAGYIEPAFRHQFDNP